MRLPSLLLLLVASVLVAAPNVSPRAGDIEIILDITGSSAGGFSELLKKSSTTLRKLPRDTAFQVFLLTGSDSRLVPVLRGTIPEDLDRYAVTTRGAIIQTVQKAAHKAFQQECPNGRCRDGRSCLLNSLLDRAGRATTQRSGSRTLLLFTDALEDCEFASNSGASRRIQLNRLTRSEDFARALPPQPALPDGGAKLKVFFCLPHKVLRTTPAEKSTAWLRDSWRLAFEKAALRWAAFDLDDEVPLADLF